MAKPTKPDRDRIAELRDLLDRANRAYYTDAESIMPDREFDDRLRELADLEARFPDLDDPNSPTRRVGGEPIDGFETRDHAVPMLSISNVTGERREVWYDRDDLWMWAKDIATRLSPDEAKLQHRFVRAYNVWRLGDRKEPPPTRTELDIAGFPQEYVVEPKIDGVALSMNYRTGTLSQVLTRGNGRTGSDVTRLARGIPDIPDQLSDSHGLPDELEIRGEAYFETAAFDALNRSRIKDGFPEFKNPRNACAGLLSSHKTDPHLMQHISLRVYGIAVWTPAQTQPATHSEAMRWASLAGFKSNDPILLADTLEEVRDRVMTIESQKPTLGFEIDGAVIRLDRYDQQSDLGTTSKSPVWCCAFKFAPDRKPTKLLEVDYQVGKTGKITPRAVMEPVLLAGTTVRHATLHNFGLVRQRDIRIGDTVEVEKAGEIIPYVVGPVLSERPASSEPIVPPNRCPVCGGLVEIEFDSKRTKAIARFDSLPFRLRNVGERIDGIKNALPDLKGAKLEDAMRRLANARVRFAEYQAELRAGRPAKPGPEDETSRLCTNPECPAQFREKLIYFVAREQMNIDGLGSATIDAVLAHPDVPLTSFADLFRLPDHRWALSSIDGIGPKTVERLADSLEAAKGQGLARVLGSLGIRHVGTVVARKLATAFGDIDMLSRASVDELRQRSLGKKAAEDLGLPREKADRKDTGLGPETAKLVHEFFQAEATRLLFEGLRSVGVSLESGVQGSPSTTLSGKIVCLTGKIEAMSRQDATNKLLAMGADVKTGVSTKTDIVIAGPGAGSKLEKANQLGIEVWDEPKLLEVLGQAENG